jgi:4-hydroxy-4-methyl-2-oxoglutarate aldolase
MHIQPSRADLIELTALNPFDRFPDGRPCVPDDLLQRMKLVTTEEAWGVLRDHGYHRQFEGRWMETHPGVITVGRAVTAQFLPHRPDYHAAIQQAGEAEGRGKVGGQNSWVIQSLQLNDVMVVDIFGKVKDGTVVGDNLGTATRSRTHVGAVIDGGIRDYQGLVQLTGVNFYVRGVDPTAIADVTLAGLNIPIRIGGATVYPAMCSWAPPPASFSSRPISCRKWSKGVRPSACAMNLASCVWMKARTPAVRSMSHPGARISKLILRPGRKRI